MSLKQEIEKFADACNQCVMNDPGSINKHIDSCPACKDHSVKLKELSKLITELKKDSQKTEKERYNVLKKRMEGFVGMTDEQRTLTIANIMDALSELSEEERVRIVKTRIDILMDMSRDERNLLFKSMKEITPDWSQERVDMELRAVNAATRDITPIKRILARNMFKKVIEV